VLSKKERVTVQLAYEKLAALIERILNPEANVMPLRGA
jgi:hypothetical protein